MDVKKIEEIFGVKEQDLDFAENVEAENEAEFFGISNIIVFNFFLFLIIIFICFD